MKLRLQTALTTLLIFSGLFAVQALAQTVSDCPAYVSALYSSARDLKLLSCQQASEIGDFKKSAFVIFTEIVESDGDSSVLLTLYKSDGFNLRSQPLAVYGPFTALAWFDVNNQKRLRSWVGDIDGDGEFELAMNVVVPPQATAFHIFNFVSESESLEPVVPVNLTDEEAKPYFLGAGTVTVDTNQKAIKVLGGRYGDDRIYKLIDDHFVEQ